MRFIYLTMFIDSLTYSIQWWYFFACTRYQQLIFLAMCLKNNGNEVHDTTIRNSNFNWYWEALPFENLVAEFEVPRPLFSFKIPFKTSKHQWDKTVLSDLTPSRSPFMSNFSDEYIRLFLRTSRHNRGYFYIRAFHKF